jgi:stage V sporulation protein B
LNKLFRGSVITFASLAITFVLRFATRVLVGRELGPAGNGIYALVVLTASWLVVFFNLGLDVSYVYFAASKRYALRQLNSHSLIAGIVLGIGGAVLALPILVGLSDSLLRGVTFPQLVLAVFSLPCGLLLAYWIKIILGLERLVTYNAINLARFALILAFVSLGLAVSGGENAVLVAWVLGTGSATLISFLVLHRLAGFGLVLNRTLTREALSFGLKSYIANLTTTFSYRADIFLVNAFLDVAAVGWYTVAVSMAEMIWYIPNAVSTALFPRVSAVGVERANEMTPVVARNVFLVILVVGLGVCLATPLLVDVLFPKGDFEPAVQALWLLMPGVIANGSAKVIFADLTGRGRPIYATYTALIGMTVTLTGDVLLIPVMGIDGAAIASSIGYSIGALTGLIWFYRETGTKWSKMLVPSRQDLIFYRRLLGAIRSGGQ